MVKPNRTFEALPPELLARFAQLVVRRRRRPTGPDAASGRSFRLSADDGAEQEGSRRRSSWLWAAGRPSGWCGGTRRWPIRR